MLARNLHLVGANYFGSGVAYWWPRCWRGACLVAALAWLWGMFSCPTGLVAAAVRYQAGGHQEQDALLALPLGFGVVGCVGHVPAFVWRIVVALSRQVHGFSARSVSWGGAALRRGGLGQAACGVDWDVALLWWTG
ncbi:hypothetical protein ATANTOWER_010536 [Ataeniobius toweri]|uniref:Uncharacterized protein n=1 Tax=Ataeniobius toweri TaxID=208326 RepID=A0ABU7BQI9_9TELE|nr:hypothetical protein [Ataeniobius toweri]